MCIHASRAFVRLQRNERSALCLSFVRPPGIKCVVTLPSLFDVKVDLESTLFWRVSESSGLLSLEHSGRAFLWISKEWIFPSARDSKGHERGKRTAQQTTLAFIGTPTMAETI